MSSFNILRSNLAITTNNICRDILVRVVALVGKL